VSENGGGGEGSSSSSSVAGVTQRCGDDAATTADMKCASLVPRDNESTTVSMTSGHVTAASEHDHMVSSTIHSDGLFLFFTFYPVHFSVSLAIQRLHSVSLRLSF